MKKVLGPFSEVRVRLWDAEDAEGVVEEDGEGGGVCVGDAVGEFAGAGGWGCEGGGEGGEGGEEEEGEEMHRSGVWNREVLSEEEGTDCTATATGWRE